MSRYSESWISKVLDDSIIDKLSNHQFVQSGIRNLTVFEHDPFAGKFNGGFTWNGTPEGHEYWEKIMNKVRYYKEYDA